MNNLLKKGFFLATLLLLMLQTISCGTGPTQHQSEAPIPLNITVLLDLSDRINLMDKSGNTQTTQLEKDSMLLMNIQKSFYNNQAPNGKFKAIGNKIKIICYPFPEDETSLSNLEFDMTISDANEIPSKKNLLKSMDSLWNYGISDIYRQTLKTNKFIGSDIWGFFNSDAEVYCNEDRYRNILLILTDGYLYHINSFTKEGTVFTGIAPQYLNVQTAIKPVSKKYDNLEVMFLEINPWKGTPNEFNKIEKLLTEWCTDMGIQKVKVVQTNSPNTTIKYIDKFIGW